MKLDNGNKVIDAIWFNSISNQTIGAVIVKIKQGGIKCYLGTAEGKKREDDIKRIVNKGAKVYPETVLRLSKHFMENGCYDSIKN